MDEFPIKLSDCGGVGGVGGGGGGGGGGNDGDDDTDDTDNDLSISDRTNFKCVKNTTPRPKDIIHKCPSDPGKIIPLHLRHATASRITSSSTTATSTSTLPTTFYSKSLKYPSGSTTRKCVLTLDGYSYVIVASSPENKQKEEQITDTGDQRPGYYRSKSSSPTQSSSQVTSPVNGQLSKPGSLTIVRRSNSKKLLQQCDDSPTQDHQQQHQQDYLANYDPNTDTTTIENFSFTGNFENMQSTTLHSVVNDDGTLVNVDLNTENLPAIDTPDACDKAALRLRGLLRILQNGEISAEILQKNLQYAARVLEAVYIDETNQDGDRINCNKPAVPRKDITTPPKTHSGPTGPPDKHAVHRRKLRTPIWASQDSSSNVRVHRKLSEKNLPQSSSDNDNKDNKRRLADEDDELSEVQPDAVPPEVREWLASTFTRQLATTRKKTDEKPKFRSVAHAIRAGIFVDRIYRRVSSSALMQFPPEVVKVLKTLDEWSFDVFALADSANGQPIKYLGYDLLNRYGIIHKFKVAPTILEIFLVKIEEGYCRFRNPYHNNLHGADVAQTVHHVLYKTGLMHWMSDLEIYATLLAALIHDYEHTGTTNNFHVMSGSDTALLYNDRAVLENHHISAAFRLLKEDECNVLANLSREEYRELRTLIIDMVLATDMSYHFQQLKNMRNLLTLAEPTVDKSKALALVLHCCDISHPAKKWSVHHRWTMLLLEEFFRQGDLERELGLPFSPLCDRNNTLVAESQIGFIEFIVEPSMAVCSDMLECILAPIAPITSKSSNIDNSGSCGTGNDDNSNNNRIGGNSETPINTLSKKVEAINEETFDDVTTASTSSSTVVTAPDSSDVTSCTTTTTVVKSSTICRDEDNPNKFRICKPWIACLVENKKIWKEQSIKDAEARAAAAATATVTAATDVPNVDDVESSTLE